MCIHGRLDKRIDVRIALRLQSVYGIRTHWRLRNTSSRCLKLGKKFLNTRKRESSKTKINSTWYVAPHFHTLFGSNHKLISLGQFVDESNLQCLLRIVNFSQLKRYLWSPMANRVEHGVSEPKRRLDSLFYSNISHKSIVQKIVELTVLTSRAALSPVFAFSLSIIRR